MLSQKLYNYLLKSNHSLDDMSVQVHNHSTCNDRKEMFQIGTRTMNRRGPTLSANATLMIEVGMVIFVMTIVGFVFYCSHRNFKKRTNIHRRRWLESDVNIEVYSDGQVYETNTSPDENSPTDLDQNDCPPPYDLVVKQPKRSSKISTPNFVKTKQENVAHTLDTNLMKHRSGCEEVEFHNCYSSETTSLEPLITTYNGNCKAVSNKESSLLIQCENVASTSTIERNDACFKRDEADAIKPNEINVETRDHLQNIQSVIKKTNLTNGKYKSEKRDANNELGRQIASPLMDISGLPSYDTAILIQEGGNI